MKPYPCTQERTIHISSRALDSGLQCAAGSVCPGSSSLQAPRGAQGWGREELSPTSSLITSQHPKELHIPGFSVWRTNALPPHCFLRDVLCIHQGAVWPFAIKSCIFHFSFFPSAVFFFFSLDLLAGMVCGGMVNY